MRLASPFSKRRDIKEENWGGEKKDTKIGCRIFTIPQLFFSKAVLLIQRQFCPPCLKTFLTVMLRGEGVLFACSG